MLTRSLCPELRIPERFTSPLSVLSNLIGLKAVDVPGVCGLALCHFYLPVFWRNKRVERHDFLILQHWFMSDILSNDGNQFCWPTSETSQRCFRSY